MPPPGPRRSRRYSPTKRIFASTGSTGRKACKSKRSMKASILTTLGGLPTVVVAIFHAHNGCSIDLANGHAEVAHWVWPNAFSLSLACIGLAFHHGLQNVHDQYVLVGRHENLWATKPNHVLTSARCVFFQLSGEPSARRVAKTPEQPKEVVRLHVRLRACTQAHWPRLRSAT